MRDMCKLANAMECSKLKVETTSLFDLGLNNNARGNDVLLGVHCATRVKSSYTSFLSR